MREPTHDKYFLIAGIIILGCALTVGTYAFAVNGNPNIRGGSSNDRYTVTTRLTGAEEVPPVNTSMRGHVTLHVSSDEQTIQYNLHADGNGTPITAAHLHCAPRGQSGPIVVPLILTSGSTGTTTMGMATITAADITTLGMNCNPNIGTMGHLIQAMREGKIYANVHTGAYPNGEIRGQLELPMFTSQTNMQHNGNSFIFDSSDLRISEVRNATSTTSTMPTRTFLVTISTNLLDHLTRLWDTLHRMF